MKSFIGIFVGLFLVGQSLPTYDIAPYPDNSLKVETYQELGMPIPDEDWSSPEYKRVVKVVKGYYNVDKWSIPRKNSEYSGALFEKIVDINNFFIIIDKEVFLQERLEEHDALLRSVAQLFHMYHEPEAETQRFGAEVLDLLILSAQTSEYSVQLLQELKAMMSEKGMRNGELDLATDKLKLGISATIIELIKVIQEDYYQYTTTDLEQFSTKLHYWSKSMTNYLDETQKAEIKNQIDLSMSAFENKIICNELKALKKAL
jgi:hypothetical protein